MEASPEQVTLWILTLATTCNDEVQARRRHVCESIRCRVVYQFIRESKHVELLNIDARVVFQFDQTILQLTVIGPYKYPGDKAIR